MIFMHQPSRRFVLCFQLINKALRLLVYDRCGVMISVKYMVDERPDVVLGIVYELAAADPSTLGYDTTMVLDSLTPYVELNGETYDIVNTIYVDGTLFGRGTTIFLVNRQRSREEAICRQGCVG